MSVHPARPLLQMVLVPTCKQLQEARERLKSHMSHNQSAQHQESVSSAQAHQREGKPAAEPPILVTMRFMDGTGFSLEVQNRNKVHVLRSEVSEKLGIGDSRVRLALDNGILPLDAAIGETGVTDGAVVTVIVVPPIYQGSPTYDRIAEGLVACNQPGKKPPVPDVHDVLEDMIAKRAALNDSFVQKIRLRKHNAQ